MIVINYINKRNKKKCFKKFYFNLFLYSRITKLIKLLAFKMHISFFTDHHIR